MRVVALVGRTKPQRIQLSRMNSSCENAQIWAPGLSSRLRWPIPTSFTESENHSAQMLRSQPDRVPQNLGFASTPDPSKRFGSDPESIGFGAERGRVWAQMIPVAKHGGFRCLRALAVGASVHDLDHAKEVSLKGANTPSSRSACSMHV